MAFVFPRTGAQIKHAAGRRRQQLSERLEAREATLDDFLNDRQGVRSYILRTANGPDFGHRGASPAQLYGPEEIASELQSVTSFSFTSRHVFSASH